MITRAQMPRQLRDKGGIASVTPRENYGLGSKIKERFRKLIPNELADVAVKAAPFVAPFNPGIAGLMRGIGRFDQRGSISDALKQGAATFGFGKLAGKIPGTQDYFGKGMEGAKALAGDIRTKAGSLFEGGGDTPKFTGKDKPGFLGDAAEKLFKNVPFSDKLSTKVKEKLLVGGLTSGASALYSYFTGEFEPQEPGESLEEYMARRRESVKSQMRQVMDSYYTPLRNPQYAAMSDEEKDKFIDSIVGQGMATGGRVGYQTGGITMANTLAENIARNRAAQSAFQQAINPSQQKIVERLQARQQAPSASETLGTLYNKKGIEEAQSKFLREAVQSDPQAYEKTGSGLASDLRHKTASAQLRDKLGGGITGQVAANVLGGIREIPQLLTGDFKGVAEDIKANFQGAKDVPKGLTPQESFDYLISQQQVDPGVETMAEKPKEDPTGYDFDSEYYRNNPGSKDFDRFKVAYAKSLGMDDQISVTPDGQVYVNFGSFDPSRTYQAYKQNKQTNYDRPFFYRSSTLSPERTAELEKQENILTSLYGSPGKTSLAKGGMPTGIMKTNKAGVMERDYRDKGGFVPVGIKEKADDVPAMLSKNEFVFTADAVRGAGNGSIEKGAQRMYDTMKNLEKRVT
jgi:hypothetical protein